MSGRGWVWIAAAAGLVHAASSASWALGSTWLLDTVGAWAVRLTQEEPLAAGLALGGIAAAKLVAALVPLGVAYGRVPWPRLWRVVSAIGGGVLVLYGGANVVVSSAVLLGAIQPEGGYDRAAMLGHAALWDPLFVVWGAALIVWLVRSRRAARPAAST